MKTSLLSFLCIIVSVSTHAQFNFTFPKEWTKDFRIEMEDKGGMLDHETTIRFTYDSCVCYSRVQGKIKKHSFLLTAAQRNEILQKAKLLRRDAVTIPRVTYDKGTDNIILFTKDRVFGVDGDSDDTEIRNTYLDTKRYLEDFALSKGKDKRKK